MLLWIIDDPHDKTQASELEVSFVRGGAPEYLRYINQVDVPPVEWRFLSIYFFLSIKLMYHTGEMGEDWGATVTIELSEFKNKKILGPQKK